MSVRSATLSDFGLSVDDKMYDYPSMNGKTRVSAKYLANKLNTRLCERVKLNSIIFLKYDNSEYSGKIMKITDKLTVNEMLTRFRILKDYNNIFKEKRFSESGLREIIDTDNCFYLTYNHDSQFKVLENLLQRGDFINGERKTRYCN